MGPPAAEAGRTEGGRNWRVRPTVAGDVPELVGLVDAVAAEGRWLLVEPGQRSAVEEQLLLAQLAGTGGLSLTLAVDGQVCGRVVVAREPEADGVPSGELAILVAAEVRGQGLGRALMEQAVEWARASGLRGLRLRVLPDNAPAIGLYRSLGFVATGLRPHPKPVRGITVELLDMALALPGPRRHPLLSSTPDE